MLGQADVDPDLLKPGVTGTAGDGPVVDPEDALPRIVVGSVTARALYRVWSGQPVTVVDSPPGAGKSTLIRDVAAHLVTRAPEVFGRRHDAVNLHLDASYRLGPDSVAAIAPLYDFPLRSARPSTSLAGHREIESLLVPATGDPNNPGMLASVAELAHALLGATLTTGEGSRPLGTADVAVVVSHNAQASVIQALLRGRDVDGVTVGTADSLQGGQWAADVALDPLTGADGMPVHAASPGLLCVMASRHYAHLTWVHDGAWRAMSSPGDGASGDR